MLPRRILLTLLIALLISVIVFVLLRLAFQQRQASLSPTPTPGILILQGLAVATVPPNVPAYNREDWRQWVDADGDCQNARAEVLIAESVQPVTFADARNCTVAGGVWNSPYDGQQHTDPQALDIDHMVPLANAHRSGGWRWDAARKEAYANSLDFPGHLIAVSAVSNRAKGDKGPEAWRPPDRNNWCQYATDWIAIKAAWDLSATPAEWNTLQDMLKSCRATIRFESGGKATRTPMVSPTANVSGLPYDPNGPDRDCADFYTWQAAQDFLLAAGGPRKDPHGLDPDGDSIACETLPRAPRK